MNSKTYLHEVIFTVPGREEPYMASVNSLHWDPMRGRTAEVEDRFAQQFRTAETSGGFPCAINIWEQSWARLTRNLSAQFQDRQRDTAMEDWWQRNLHLRRGGYDRVLIPAAYSPDGAQLRKRSVRGGVFLHEVAWLQLGEPERYLGELEQKLLPVAAKLGIELIGAYRVAMRPRQVLTVLGAGEWSQFARLLEAAGDSKELRAWQTYREKQVARSEELVLLPARHDPLAARR